MACTSGLEVGPFPEPLKQSSSSQGLPLPIVFLADCFVFDVVVGGRVGGTYTGVIKSSPETDNNFNFYFI